MTGESWTRALRTQGSRRLLDLIAIAVLVAFIAIWFAVLYRSLVEVGPSAQTDTPESLSEGLTAAAGAITTLLATRTASVLGFTITELRGEKPRQVTPSALNANLNWSTKAAIIVYVIVGVAVVLTWLWLNVAAPEVVTAYALGLLGWLGGAAGVAFATRAPAMPPIPPTPPVED
ncbi:hypothetical protein ACDF64_12090 [Agromyces sp. MMS24-JH15]|uniref:hypothetical protein n=1 Tax=Agromyces sp. MMS24-JH15 TaxID=3243765 RepID=UPI003748B8EE